MTMFPKTTPIRLKGNAMRVFRFEIFKRDGGKCVDCGCMVSFNGTATKYPPMHLAHKRSKRLWGDTAQNCQTKCPTCHLVKEHMGGKVVPSKHGGANEHRTGSY